MSKYAILPAVLGAAMLFTASPAIAGHDGYNHGHNHGYDTTRTVNKDEAYDRYGHHHDTHHATAPYHDGHHHDVHHTHTNVDTPYRGGASDYGDNQSRGVNTYIPGRVRVYNDDGTSYLNCPPAQAKKRGC